MAAPALKQAEVDARPGEIVPSLALADRDCEPQESPARALQARLQTAVSVSDYPEPYVEKAHPLARLGVLFGLTSGSWAVILLVARLILRS